MSENTAITRHGESCAVQFRRNQFDRIVDKRMTNILVINLIFARDSQFFNNSSAWVLSHLFVLCVVVVICGAEIGLAGGESLGYFDVEESISHAKSLLHMRSLLHMSLFRWQLRAEQRV